MHFCRRGGMILEGESYLILLHSQVSKQHLEAHNETQYLKVLTLACSDEAAL